MSKYMTLQQAADWSGYKTNTLQRYVREGKIDGVKEGRELMINKQSLLEYTQRGGRYIPHAEHTRNRAEKLAEVHDGGLDLELDPEQIPGETPQEKLFNALFPEGSQERAEIEDATRKKIKVVRVPDIEIIRTEEDDEMDSVIRALLDTAFDLFKTMMELAIKAGHRAAQLDAEEETEVQA